MRTNRLFRYVFFSLLSISLSCKKHSSSPDPLSQLPPETETGKGTFGCLLNGQAFKPKGRSSNLILSCAYDYSVRSDRNGYYFGISADARGKTSCEGITVGFGTDSIELEEGKTYVLKNKHNGGGFGSVYRFPGCDSDVIHYATSEFLTGELEIKKLDDVHQIISGTFWFTATDNNGDTVKITNGRFDMPFWL